MARPFMSAMLALLHLNFSDSSAASWDDRQAASTGHWRIHFLNFDFCLRKSSRNARVTVLTESEFSQRMHIFS